MRIFATIWAGQFVSLIGTGMTRFALLFWAYQQTEQATTVALLGFFSFLPAVIVSPFAGVLVDRYDRRWVMILADVGAGVMTTTLLLLFVNDQLAIWHLYVAQAAAGAFEAFQGPAFTAITSTVLPKAQYGRASGLRAVADYGAQVAAPMFAGVMLFLIGIQGVMVVDIATFLCAVLTLIFVRVPPSTHSRVDRQPGWRPFFREMRVGWQFIWERPGLRGLLAIFTGINLFAALTYFAILPAMILARTQSNELALATVQAVLGGAGVVGGIILSIWGGPRRQIHAVLAGAAISFLFGDFLFAVGRTLPVWITAAAVASFFIPFISGGNQVIWQRKVPPALQGRVISVRTMVQLSGTPIGYLIAGPIADLWLEPAMRSVTPSSPEVWGSFVWLVGSGPGAGMGLMFLFTAVMGCLISLGGYFWPAVRRVELDLPDHNGT